MPGHDERAQTCFDVLSVGGPRRFILPLETVGAFNRASPLSLTTRIRPPRVKMTSHTTLYILDAALDCVVPS